MIEVEYCFKRNQRIIKPKLHPWHETMLKACMRDLDASGVNADIEVVFQTGHSNQSRRIYGYCQFDWQHNRYHKVVVYTYRLQVPTVMRTIAHEFGHIAHFATLPQSRGWCKENMEAYANAWENEMMKLVGGK